MSQSRTAFALAAALALSALAFPQSASSAEGKFKGASNHRTTGTATLKRQGKTWTLEISSDFTFDGAPDPKWAFGNKGVDKTTIFAPLKSNKGAQSYSIPATIDPSKYKRVILYCEKYSVPLGVAKLRF